MEFTNEFTVPVGIERTFALLTDLERVAPCLPGAALDDVDGDVYAGSMKVKVGPITVAYRGTAEVVEQDAAAGRVAIDAAGKETRGAGTASARVTATLAEVDAEQTAVTVTTDLTLTGKPAQFGRGVLAEVGSKIIGTFAERLEGMIQEGELEPAGSEAAPATTEPAPVDPEGAEAAPDSVGHARATPEPEPLDLREVAGGAIVKRLIPVVAALAVVAGILWWWRRRS
jgi:uncharacterized protein